MKFKVEMKLNVDLPQLDAITISLKEITNKLDKIHMTGQEALAAIKDIGVQLGKAKDEIVAKIAALEAALQNVELPAEAASALADLKTQAQALDDVVPDAAPPA